MSLELAKNASKYSTISDSLFPKGRKKDDLNETAKILLICWSLHYLNSIYFKKKSAKYVFETRVEKFSVLGRLTAVYFFETTSTYSVSEFIPVKIPKPFTMFVGGAVISKELFDNCSYKAAYSGLSLNKII